MKTDIWDIGVCTWSMQAGIDEVAEAMGEMGLKHVHLAVGPALEIGVDKFIEAVKKKDWVISSTMIDFPQEDYSTVDSIKITGGVLPDDSWQGNKERFSAAAKITKELGVKYLSTHAGFIDETDIEQYRTMCARIKCLGDIAAEYGIMLLMETGQEEAKELSAFLKEVDHPAVGVNFDPANMILYSKGNPIEAVKVLGPWIKHVHIKDANLTKVAGQWGSEVPWGDGQVGSVAFLRAIKEIGYCGSLAIEREAGDNRAGDIALAIERLQGFKV
jgi:L-ribulose-5-phosphate 3-epimerase